MQNMGTAGGNCLFEFNFDPASFKPGDTVSYRIPDAFGDSPLVGTILAVHEDHVELSPNDSSTPGKRMRGTRESRPVVHSSDAL